MNETKPAVSATGSRHENLLSFRAHHGLAGSACSEAGAAMLRAGGSAIDAAIAAQMVLVSSNRSRAVIGGGAFLLHHDGRQTVAFDGRETAPAAADEDFFLRPDGKPMSFHEAVVGGRAVGVPGAVRMLEVAHAEYGTTALGATCSSRRSGSPKRAFRSRRLHTLLKSDPHLRLDRRRQPTFYDGDGAAGCGRQHLAQSGELAAVLRRVAAEGSRALHEGEIAQAIVDKVREHPDNPGKLSLADLAGYQPQRRLPYCSGYAPPGPTAPRLTASAVFRRPVRGRSRLRRSSAFSIRLRLRPCPLPTRSWLHYYSEASRLAFADRAQLCCRSRLCCCPCRQLVLADRARLPCGPCAS
jgi:gamma-glutamyltranspeptidase/glutathione hydrolase